MVAPTALYAAKQFVQGHKASDKVLETFAEKLAETFVQGDLHIAEWSTEKGAAIKVTLAFLYTSTSPGTDGLCSS
jgi:hypothetical protein